MSPELTAAAYESDGVTVVEVAGVLDVSTAATLHEVLAAIALDGGLAVRMDLTALDFLDSFGVGVIVRACRRVRESGGTFSVECGPGPVRAAIKVMGLLEFLGVISSGG